MLNFFTILYTSRNESEIVLWALTLFFIFELLYYIPYIWKAVFNMQKLALIII